MFWVCIGRYFRAQKFDISPLRTSVENDKMHTEVSSEISIEGHPTESLQSFLRSYFGIESHHALQDLCLPGGALRNAELLMSIESGRRKPTEDFNLTYSEGKRVSERDLLPVVAKYYERTQNATVHSCNVLIGTLILEMPDKKLMSVAITAGEKDAYITVKDLSPSKL